MPKKRRISLSTWSVPYACRYGVRAFGPITPVADNLATEAHDYLLKPSIVKGTFDYWCRQADRLRVCAGAIGNERSVGNGAS
jgi:L-fuculose-phosphate aldolase